MRISRPLRYTLVAAWTTLIWSMSTQSRVPGDPVGTITDAVRQVPIAPAISFYRLRFIIQKGGHMILYAALAILIFAALNSILSRRIIHTMLIGISIAAVDETIQSFVPGRDGNIRDVFIDTLGLALGVMFVLLLRRIYLQLKKTRRLGGLSQNPE